MEEQQHRNRPAVVRRDHGPPFGGAAGSEPADDFGTVQVIWGATMDDFEVAGMTVAEAHQLLAGPFHIPPDVAINLNGELVNGDTRLTSGDTLEFVRAAGEKGAIYAASGTREQRAA
ncbi:MAG: MoaD/ThiS family protein [bacterium]|nr:MoaD/ThiS family protein [bacterium]